MFAIASETWVDLSSSAASGPGGRDCQGFTSDGRWLYVYGGKTQSGMFIGRKAVVCKFDLSESLRPHLTSF